MIVSTTFIYRLLYLILGFSLLALLAVPVVVACQPLEKDARTRLDTRSLDGLRGLAAMHVAIGHYVSFTGLAGRFSDLQAGSSMGLFYLLSGFVMARLVRLCRNMEYIAPILRGAININIYSNT